MMSTALLFSGQGAQKVGMGHSLCHAYPSAKAWFDQADRVFGESLSRICFEGPESVLTETRVCQPALYVHGYTLFKLLEEQGHLSGLKAALGLSLGEVTALAAAGVFDFETGLRIVAERGRLMQEACDATQGAMASLIGGEISAVEALCAEFDVDLANLNCPGQIVVSGEAAKVAALVDKAKTQSFKMVVPLKVAGAYHSRLMRPAADRFAAFLEPLPFACPTITVFTNTTGEAIDDPAAIKQALVKQVFSPVRWEDCMRGAITLGVERCFECGPGAVLAGLARRIDRNQTVIPLSEAEDLAKLNASA
jgi:[acyl-carrier-protein] S-malonyltransferase